MSLTDSSRCVLPGSEQCCYRSFNLNKGMALASVSSRNAFPEACLVGNPWYIYYTRMRLQNPIYIASPGREILICCNNDLTRPLNSRHGAEDTKAIHSNNSFPFVPIDQLLGRFQFMYVTVVFRTEKKSTNFKN